MMFFIYSFIGWVIEVIYYGITEGKFINRGFLAGPLCPVYGLGFYAAIWFFEPFANNFMISGYLSETFRSLTSGKPLSSAFSGSSLRTPPGRVAISGAGA